MRISDWSSDVCSSDLVIGRQVHCMLGRLRKGIALGKTWGAFIIFRMQIAIIGIEQQPRCGLYCCFQLQTVSGGLGSIRYPDIGLARIADAECASDRKSKRLNSSR